MLIFSVFCKGHKEGSKGLGPNFSMLQLSHHEMFKLLEEVFGVVRGNRIVGPLGSSTSRILVLV